MYKLILTVAIALSLLACNGSKKSIAAASPLNGTWIPVKQEMNGKALPPAAFASQKLILRDSTYIFNAESEDKGTVRISGDKMDIYGVEGVNKGKHFTCLWKLENGQLSVCYNLAGNSYPESFDTKGKPVFFFAQYRKE